MLVKALLAEFDHEVENTRKLLKMIPDDALHFKPSDKSWTTAQLASHIAEVYNWYPATLEENVFDMATYKYDKGDVSKAANIINKFEENVKTAREALENATDESMFENWKMVMGNSDPMFPEMPRVQVVRGFLMNHLYHHRGEMVIYLRSTGNRVPNIYGPTFEESQQVNQSAAATNN